MNGNRALAAAGCAAFVIALAALLPAQLVLRWLAPAIVQPAGVTGTLWRGSAAGATVGAVRLGETAWHVAAPSLLLGRLAADVETRIGDGSAGGSLAINLAGHIACTDCRFAGPVASLKSMFPALGTLVGRLEIELATLEVRDRWPARVMGTASIAGVPIVAPGAVVSPATPRAGFEATLSADPVPDDGRIEAAVQDTGGPVQLRARLVVTKPGNFELAGSAQARADAPAEIARALSMLGRPGPDGGTELSLAGTF